MTSTASNAAKSHKGQYIADQLVTLRELDFYDARVVFVSADGSNTYHKSDCSHWDRSSFWAFNTEAVDYKYNPCGYCIYEPATEPGKPTSKFCRHCGAKLEDGDIYCIECGEKQ